MTKTILLIVLATLTMVLAGCSRRSPTASTPRAIDLVQAGKDIEFPGGYVLHVTKRDGSSVEGIHIHFPHPGGSASEITAGTGTIKSGIPGASDSENQTIYQNQITITLNHAKSVTGPTNVTFVKMVICLSH